MIFTLWNDPSSLAIDDFVTVAQRAVEDARDRQPSEIVAVVEIGDQDLQWSVGVAARRRNGLHDGFEQRLQVLARSFEIRRRRALLRIRVEHREVELVFARRPDR